MHFVREPVGEWVLLDAETRIAEGGAGPGELGAQRPDGTGRARRTGAVRRATMIAAVGLRHERDARGAAAFSVVWRPRLRAPTIASTSARSTTFISNSAKLAPMQRRTPPPNGIHV